MNENKVTIIASFSILPELNNVITAEAKRQGISRSKLICKAFTEYMDAQNEKVTVPTLNAATVETAIGSVKKLLSELPEELVAAQ